MEDAPCIRNKTINGLLILVLAFLLSGSKGCSILDDENMPDINGWWELTFQIQSSTCPDQVNAYLASGNNTVKFEFSQDKANELLSGNLYDDDKFVGTAKGNMNADGSFEIHITVTYDIDELYMKLTGQFTETYTSGQMFQQWRLRSQNVECQVEGRFSGKKL